jgi:hypothetical protein
MLVRSQQELSRGAETSRFDEVMPAVAYQFGMVQGTSRGRRCLPPFVIRDLRKVDSIEVDFEARSSDASVGEINSLLIRPSRPTTPRFQHLSRN